jgi:apolipoprotein N-acyltransferase
MSQPYPESRQSAGGEPRRSLGSVVLRAAGAIAGGALLASGWLRPGWIVPAWFAALALLVFSRARRPRSALLWCWLLGLVGHIVAFYWVPGTIQRFSTLPGWLAEMAFMAGCSIGALQFGAFGAVACWLRLRGRARPWVVAAVWASFELVWPTVFPWRLGQTQIEWTAMVQIAELTGVYGIGFLMMWLVEAALQLAEQQAARRGAADAGRNAMNPGEGDPRPGLRVEPWVAAGVAVAALGFGLWRERDLQARIAASPPLRVGLVQCADELSQRASNLRRLSQEIGDQVDLLCWPESSLGSLKYEPRQLPAAMRPYSGRRCYLVAGCSVKPDDKTDDRWLNSAILIDPEEHVVGRYDKRTLIPFGEYVPGETWFPALHGLTVFPQRYRGGVSAEPLRMAGAGEGQPDRARLGVLICYEDVLAGLARSSTAAGADLLVNLTNDRWFGDSHALPQHQQLARFRSIENRRYLLRCTMTGSTSIIDPLGRVVEQAPGQLPVAIVETVTTLGLRTVYTACGDVFGWSCVAVMGVAVLTAKKKPHFGERLRKSL